MVESLKACPAKAPGRPGTVYFLKDHLGSVRATVDQAGAVKGYDDYDPWGYILAGRSVQTPWSNPDANSAAKNKFTGKEHDDEFGINLDYFGERYYDSEIGRWLSVDPLADERPEESPYSYAGNNPVTRIDPDGLYWIDTDGDGKADTWVIEEPIVVEAERPVEEGTSASMGLAGLGAIALAEPTPIGEAIFLVGSGIYVGYRIGQYLAEENADKVEKKEESSKSKSKFWKQLKPYRGKTKTNGETGKRRKYYEWDHTHGDIEVYDHTGKHIGSANPNTGEIIKPPVPGRSINL